MSSIKITDDKLAEGLLEFAQASTGRSAAVLREAADRIKLQGECITKVKKEHRILKDMISKCIIDTTGLNGFKCPTCMHLHEHLGLTYSALQHRVDRGQTIPGVTVLP